MESYSQRLRARDTDLNDPTEQPIEDSGATITVQYIVQIVATTTTVLDITCCC